MNLEKRHRRSIKLRGYDYASTGAYFVTICAHGKVCLFGDIADEKMRSQQCRADDQEMVGRIEP